jgi:hypothetical protein
VIFGQYKTGTTGLFYLINDSLSGDVRTLFEAQEYNYEEGDRDRWVLAKVILGIQSDEFAIKYDTFLNFDKQIYLIRDPRDWLISGLLFSMQQEPSIYDNDEVLARLLKLLKQKEADPTSVPLTTIAEIEMAAIPARSLEQLRSWVESQLRWLIEFEDRLSDYYALRYEDFVDGKLEGLEDYLQMPLCKTADCDVEHGHVARTKSYGNWRNWFLPEDVEFFRPVFDFYLTHYRYPPEWQLNDPQTIRPEHCSQYVERTVFLRKQSSR